jgi:hypothetical protein
MARPKCHRNICGIPDKHYFKPRGIPASDLEEVSLNLDEFEAIRLADYERLYQQEAARQMNISRQTFGRIIDAAHQKIADVLIKGKALKIVKADAASDNAKISCQSHKRKVSHNP